ncbi:MAG: site-2 protease family protein [Planctomycetales bacterium]|nr:site-2 protease family protein [Planctomycetales bacterium]
MGSSLLVDGMNAMTLADWLPILLAESSTASGLLKQFWLFFQVALGLGFVIFVHELGHFLAAKTFGVRCDKFYVGFDVPISIGPIHLPRTLGKFQWGETEYGIGIIPLGGYVKMLGQDDDPRKQAEENEKIRAGGSQEEVEEVLDPRSYPAKPVWQRMIIISAGVVMNLIFAVVLAGIAYRCGVAYTPTVVGSSMGGGPAWQIGLQPGDQVLRFGEMKSDVRNMRYDDFAIGVIMRGFAGNKPQLPLTIEHSGQRKELVATPTADYDPDREIYRIGLNPPNTPRLGDEPYTDISFLHSVAPDLRSGDLITAVNGETLPTDERFKVALGSELTARLQAHWEQSIELTIERKSQQEGREASETVQVELPPVPVKSLGIGFEPGPIVALQEGSLGQKAGMQVGDVIEAVNDEPVVDGLALPSLVARSAGQEVRLRLRRPSGDSDSQSSGESVVVAVQCPPEAAFDPISNLAGRLTLAGLGVAFEVTSTISQLDESLADGELAVGDKLTQVHWLADVEQQKSLKDLFTPKAFVPQPIDKSFNVASLYGFMQSLPEGARLKCYVQHDGKTLTKDLVLKNAEDWYWHQRGIMLSPLMDIHETKNLVSAAQLGLWETSRRFTDVLDFLRLLVTGRIGARGVGGPVAIVNAASTEASLGVSRLLLFLTLLSANLAILNFLPIPALDGGHMVFLTFEAIRGKPVSEALQIRLTMAGVLGLLCLMAFVIVKDIIGLVG